MNKAAESLDAGGVDSAAVSSGEAGQGTAVVDNNGMIKNHVITAMGLGLVPIPVFDVVSIVGVQLNMVRNLAKAYDVPFSENLVRASILSLIGGSAPAGLGVAAASLVKVLPGLGTVSGAAGVSVLSGGLTYAVGHIFDRHLASEGTLLSFDASKVRDLFKRKVKEGQSVASDITQDAK